MSVGFAFLFWAVLFIGQLFILKEVMKVAEDFSKLTASITKLQADVATLIAGKTQTNQAAIDAATQAVDAIDATVTAATPAPPAA